ncbi:MAG: hypothetical protein JW727_05265 [Candidatus Aenigmarchaeota archaeon]|nr:hypothetical protein [Candidatus Aenigmarchaeota archaeon]
MPRAIVLKADWTEIGLRCVGQAMDALRKLKQVKTLDTGFNPHTDADLVSHGVILNTLQTSGISSDLISEEADGAIRINGGGPDKVFTDPLDGTINFMRGDLSFCAVGLFVASGGVPRYSFVGDLATGDIYHCDEKYAYVNGEKMALPEMIEGRYVVAGWAAGGPRLEAFLDKMRNLPTKYRMFNYGQMLQSAKISLGQYDACFEILPSRLSEFAGAIIAQRAGAKLSTLEGKPIVWEEGIKQTMLVSRSASLHEELLEIFNSPAGNVPVGFSKRHL